LLLLLLRPHALRLALHPFPTRRSSDLASFLHVDNVTLAYTFSSNIPPNVAQYVRRARVYPSAQNLFVFTPYEGYDPEVNTDAQENGVPSLGVDYANYPRPRTFTLGLSLGF